MMTRDMKMVLEMMGMMAEKLIIRRAISIAASSPLQIFTELDFFKCCSFIYGVIVFIVAKSVPQFFGFFEISRELNLLLSTV